MKYDLRVLVHMLERILDNSWSVLKNSKNCVLFYQEPEPAPGIFYPAPKQAVSETLPIVIITEL